MARYLIALFILACALPVCSQELLPSELSADDEAPALRAAEKEGLIIYRHDHAASVATDAVRELRGFRRGRGISGWVTEARGHEITVTFVGNKKGQPPAALFRATVSDDGWLVHDAIAHKPPQPLTEFEAAALKARTLAISSGFEACTKTYNTVVLPTNDGTAKGWRVYLLPSTTKPDVIPAGGTHRLEIDETATHVVSRRAYLRTCLALQNDPKAVALMMTHLLDATPTEAHVFWGLSAGKSVYVSTPPHGALWEIKGGKINLIERDSPKN